MGRAQYIACLAFTAAVTIAAMIIAAASANKPLSATAVAIFAITAVAVTWLLQRRQSGLTGPASAVALARTNAALIAATFAWGGCAILCAYYLTDLFWHHAWQYGLAMLLLAGVALGYRRALSNPDGRWRKPRSIKTVAAFTILQGLAAALGILFVFWSGKVFVDKPDWLANHVFIAGGAAICVQSLIAGRAQFRHQD